MKQFVQKVHCFVKIFTHIPFDPNTLDLPPQNAKFHHAQEGGEEFFGGKQRQQLLCNFTTPSKSIPTAHYRSLHLHINSSSKSVFSEPTK
jgi:hypothetical protein